MPPFTVGLSFCLRFISFLLPASQIAFLYYLFTSQEHKTFFISAFASPQPKTKSPFFRPHTNNLSFLYSLNAHLFLRLSHLSHLISLGCFSHSREAIYLDLYLRPTAALHVISWFLLRRSAHTDVPSSHFSYTSPLKQVYTSLHQDLSTGSSLIPPYYSLRASTHLPVPAPPSPIPSR